MIEQEKARRTKTPKISKEEFKQRWEAAIGTSDGLIRALAVYPPGYWADMMDKRCKEKKVVRVDTRHGGLCYRCNNLSQEELKCSRYGKYLTLCSISTLTSCPGFEPKKKSIDKLGPVTITILGECCATCRDCYAVGNGRHLCMEDESDYTEDPKKMMTDTEIIKPKQCINWKTKMGQGEHRARVKAKLIELINKKRSDAGMDTIDAGGEKPQKRWGIDALLWPLFDQGLTQKEVIERTRKDKSDVCRSVKRWEAATGKKLPKEKPGRVKGKGNRAKTKTEERQAAAERKYKQVIELHKRGMSTKQIAEDMHISTGHVWYYLKKAGLWEKAEPEPEIKPELIKKPPIDLEATIYPPVRKKQTIDDLQVKITADVPESLKKPLPEHMPCIIPPFIDPRPIDLNTLPTVYGTPQQREILRKFSDPEVATQALIPSRNGKLSSLLIFGQKLKECGFSEHMEVYLLFKAAEKMYEKTISEEVA